MDKESKNNLAVPLAIVAAGALIAGAVFFSGDYATPKKDTTFENTGGLIADFSGVSPDDYVTGSQNPEAITLVEYSDLECPFCKYFHVSMKDVLTRHSDVAWIYRHYPINSIHKKAWAEGVAAECAGQLGGNDKFWEYVDLVFDTTSSNDGLDLSLLPEFATQIGLDVADFNTCLESSEADNEVTNDYTTGSADGVTGTPFLILVDSKGQAWSVFDQYFNPDKADLTAEEKSLVEDIYETYQNTLNEVRNGN